LDTEIDSYKTMLKMRSGAIDIKKSYRSEAANKIY